MHMRVKVAIIAMLALFAFVLPTAAQATSFNVSQISIHKEYSVGINVPGGYSGLVWAAPFKLKGKVNGTGPDIWVTAFCVDVYDETTDGSKSPAYVYTLQDLTDDGNGHPISAYDESRLAWLLDYGFHQTDNAILAEVQVGIWMLINRTHGVTFMTNGAFNTSMMTAATAFSNTTNTLSGGVVNLVKPGDQHLAISPIPEPTTWTMLLIGFGLAGFAMRAGRRGAANDDSLLEAKLVA